MLILFLNFVVNLVVSFVENFVSNPVSGSKCLGIDKAYDKVYDKVFSCVLSPLRLHAANHPVGHGRHPLQRALEPIRLTPGQQASCAAQIQAGGEFDG
jgi:hypothetical protein